MSTVEANKIIFQHYKVINLTHNVISVTGRSLTEDRFPPSILLMSNLRKYQCDIILYGNQWWSYVNSLGSTSYPNLWGRRTSIVLLYYLFCANINVAIALGQKVTSIALHSGILSMNSMRSILRNFLFSMFIVP